MSSITVNTSPTQPVQESSFSLLWTDNTPFSFSSVFAYSLYINNILVTLNPPSGPTTSISGTNFNILPFPNISTYIGQGNFPVRVVGTDGYDKTYNTLYIACFLKGTKILSINENNEKIYKPIEDISENSYVETYKHGAKKVLHRTKQFHRNERSPAQMCKFPKCNDLFEDLYITGTHSLMVDELSRTELKNTLTIQDEPTIVDGKYLINSYIKDGVELIDDNETYEVYHLVLENDDIDGIYGIYANGILAESMSIAFHKKNFKNNQQSFLTLE